MSQQSKDPDDSSRGPRGFRGRQGKEGPTGPVSNDDELLAELRNVGSSLAFRQQVRRLLKIIGGVAFVALIASIMSVVAYLAVRNYQEVACERDNDLRAAYTEHWSTVLKNSPPPQPPPDGASQEDIDKYNRQVEQRNSFEASLKGFSQHPC